MIRTRTLAVFAALLVVGGLAAQAGAVPSMAASQESPSEEGPTGVTVDAITAPETASPNSSVNVAATVTNNGNESVTEAVEFRFAGAVADRTLVTLEPNETTTVNFEGDTTGVEAGEYTHGVFTSDDGQTATIGISESFTLESLEAPTNATAGDNVTVTANVRNPNNFTTNQSVEFRLAGQPVAAQTVSLDANASTDVTFTVDTTGTEPATYTHSVFTRDDGTFAEITIEPAVDIPDDNETEEPPANETEEPPANETEEPTEGEETEEPTEDGTEEATEDGTEEATEDGTEEATEDGTEEATEDGTEEATEDGTEEATDGEETEDETEDGTEEATTDA